ncbi:MAG: YbaB/EbfC family nucleoid-associated protein [Clostridia bacterium]
MAGFGGFGGGQNMQQLMKQAQKMQADALRAQQEIEETIIEGTSGGGMVKVQMNGKKIPISISISKDVVDPNDKEMLEDLIMAALSDAATKAEALSSAKMGRLGGII